MTRDDIIRKVREDDLQRAYERGYRAGIADERDRLEPAFKQLEVLMQVRETQPNKPCCLAEREACARVCDGVHARHIAEYGDFIGETYAAECAVAIRARGKE